jgi:hypothetical protein
MFGEFFLGLYLKVMSALRSEKARHWLNMRYSCYRNRSLLNAAGTGLQVNNVYSKINSALGLRKQQ